MIGTASRSASKKGKRWRGQDYPCRCQSGCWGLRCGHSRDHCSGRRVAAPSSSHRADARTRGSRSSRQAPRAPQGRRLEVWKDTGVDTETDIAEPQPPGAERRENKKLSQELLAQGSSSGRSGEQRLTGILRVSHSPVPRNGGAGRPAKDTAFADRG